MNNKKENFFVRKQKAEKIFGVAQVRPQDANMDYLKERRKSIYPRAFVTHPHPDLVENWTFSDNHLQVSEYSRSVCGGRPIMVDSAESFAAMMEEIKEEPTLGFDVEGHMQYSYGSMISLMQISTFRRDYLLDPFQLHREIRTELKTKLEDPGTLLVLHGGANDLLWLKGEFQIFPLGVIDTQVCHMVLMGQQQGISFEVFKEKYLTSCLGSKPRYDKAICQLADWRIRPLPIELKIYSSEDSHLVLLGWNEILKKNETYAIKRSLALTKDLLLKPWEPPKFSYESQIKKLGHKFVIAQDDFETFNLLWRFQVYLGRLIDQNPASFFPVTALAAIATTKPVERLSLRLTVVFIPKTVPWQAEYSYIRLLQTGEKALEAFMKLRCNICNIQSHPAWACSEYQNAQTRKFHTRNFETPEKKDITKIIGVQ